VWEFQFEGKGVESFSGVVSELEFVGVFIKFEDLEDLGDNIEISVLFGGFVEIDRFLSSNGS
jgi:hypothetical protein